MKNLAVPRVELLIRPKTDIMAQNDPTTTSHASVPPSGIVVGTSGSPPPGPASFWPARTDSSLRRCHPKAQARGELGVLEQAWFFRQVSSAMRGSKVIYGWRPHDFGRYALLSTSSSCQKRMPKECRGVGALGTDI